MARGRGIGGSSSGSRSHRRRDPSPDSEDEHGIHAQEEAARKLFLDPDPSDRRTLLIPISGGEFRSPCRTYARQITSLMKWLDEPYVKFGEWPDVKKQILFNEFKKVFKFPPDYTDVQLYKSFKKKCGNLFRGKIYEHKQKVFGGGPDDWDRLALKINRPGWAPPEHWGAMVEKWAREDYQKKRAAAWANRMAQEDRCIYTGGSVPQSAYEEELAHELGREPTQMELFKRTKQSRKKEGNVEFARPHDQQIFDEYYKDMVKKYGDNPATWSPVDHKLWMKAAHTPSQQHPKPYIYGYGASRDTSGFFPERRGKSQSQSSAHPRFLDFIRERVTIMFQELQRSGSHGVPSFTAQSSRRHVLSSDEDDGGESGDGGGEYGGEGGDSGGGEYDDDFDDM